jgi:phage tail P2-like protein
MRSLSDVSLLELVPSNLRQDPFVAAFSKAFDYEFRLLVAAIPKIILFANINNQPAEVLDYLAWQLGADFYDQSADLTAKRVLISQALYWASIKGTPHAIERVISIVFGDGTHEDWFEYGGEPFHFRVRVSGGRFPDSTKYDLFMRMIRAVKRASAVLESITVEQSGDLPLNFGGTLQIGETVTLGSA